jgi:hypothetical protein
MILNEGGNIFKDTQGQPLTQRINRVDVAPTIQWLENTTGLELTNNTLGSTGIKDTSGDLDLAIDANTITKEAVIDVLVNFCKRSGLNPTEYVKKSGAGVHFKTPIKGNAQNGFVQTDFMFLKDVDFSKFVLGAMPADSKYKGVDRNVLINSMAKSMGAKLDQTKGLVQRMDGSIISNNPDEIAKILLNKLAHAADLRSVESIMAALTNDPKREEKIDDAMADYQRRGVPIPGTVAESTLGWFRRFSDMVQ